MLTLPTDISHPTAHSIRSFSLSQQDIAGFFQIIRPLAGAGIVQAQAEIPPGCAAQPLLDNLPRGEQIRQGNHTEIMAQGRTQHGSSGQGRCDPRHHLDLHRGILRRQLEQQPCHAIDTGVATTHHGYIFSLLGCFQCPAAAINLLLHGGGVGLFLREQRGNQLHIDRVAAQHLGLLQRCLGLSGEKFLPTGTNANNI